MKATDVQFVIGLSGYFVKDLEAVRRSPAYDPLGDNIPPRTPGFRSVVQAGQVISIMLHLPCGEVAVGDCVDVIFSGAASRDSLFIAEEHLPVLESVVKPWLRSCDISNFRQNAKRVDLPWKELQGRRLHTAVRYGLTQALLAATALVQRRTIAEVICREWSLISIADHPIDILASCHRNDTLQLDRMIMKKAPMLPHASFVHVSDIGPQGTVLMDYVDTVARRIQERAPPGYHPRLHFDVYGTLGDVFPETTRLADFLGQLRQHARPYALLIESPIIASSKSMQIQRLADLRACLKRKGIDVKIVADEWCNTLQDIRDFADADAVDYVQIKMPDLGGVDQSIDAVLYCHGKGIGCCLGGSANETDVSARITAHVALATRPDFLLSKPGIGADEGLMILTNEMLRGIALAKRVHCKL
ncbi:putative methylaspartate ammonia-lyase [Aspergillus novofumigatus IBT 16806]|uniref:methylaspartate ammonia-lyase n=1 Tax=Aspergillus novofumigatus (strain IBT 16806) TaxID=1392255 RepID=A0A2I1BV52_ASPN1|nr:methylaspartate ammonia-lyase C-terminal domain protein [Aspergillus novofumigatus IBT 16806]PKX89246.1 methylaspartate ammonia-lyase C-terminal domain protein [Aspergillus novofumigatus IBT 16806]